MKIRSAPLIVMKFGGTSVADISHIRHVAEQIKQHRNNGYQVIAVVSAMGEETDRLVSLVNQITDQPNRRELDMLLTAGERITMALLGIVLNDIGIPAISFTGSQSGIITDNTHTRAKIVTVQAFRIEKELSQGKVVVVAGFQGVSQEKEVTTLGRGGSDTTAVALAGALGAERCEIYTDVPGVFAVDPRLRSTSQRLPAISYEEMIELAGAGSYILETRSVLFAKKFQLPLWIGSLSYDSEGTIVDCQGSRSSPPVLGVALSKKETIFSLIGVKDYPLVIDKVLNELSQHNIPFEILFQNPEERGSFNFTFIVPDSDSNFTQSVINQTVTSHDLCQVVEWDNLARVSIIGKGMKGVPGITVKLLGCLDRQNIPVFLVTTSDLRISAFVPRKKSSEAVNKIADVFNVA